MNVDKKHKTFLNTNSMTARALCAIFILLLLSAGVASAATITVDDSGGADYTTIQDAIDAVTAGDTIEVRSGTYYENVNVNKQLTLRGIGNPVVDAQGSGNAITLAADGIILDGFTATGGGSYPNAGIWLDSSNNTLSGNTASNNTYYGIWLYSSSNNTLSGNTASNNYGGIMLSSSSNNILYHNNLVDNTVENAHDYGNNQWDWDTTGNYYSDYTGIDSDGDGIGNTPYPIPGGSSVDRYPLMAAWVETPSLSVTITSPTDGATVNTPTIIISGTASDDVAVASVTVNGISATGTTSWSVDINLTEGANIITAVATDTSGNTATDVITITYTSAAGTLVGDVNGDGILSSVDALMALQMSAGNIAQNLVADVSGDGNVTSLDALMILQASVGAIVL